jgi:hypothetical protein
MREFYTFGIKYSQEHYDCNKITGFRRSKVDFNKSLYGGNIIHCLRQNDGPVIIFVGDKGTIDAGVRVADLELLPLDLMRQVYANIYGKDRKSWTKTEIMGKLAPSGVA